MRTDCFRPLIHSFGILRRPERLHRPIHQSIDTHTSDVLAGGAGIAAAGSWALAAGAAATTAAGAKPATTADGGAALCDDAISHLRDPKTGKEIYLIGTAHISNASAQVRDKVILFI